MDALDRRILAELGTDARKPLTGVADALGVAPTTLHQRVKRLEERGVIVGSRLVIDWAAAGYPVVAVVSIEVGASSLEDVAQSIESIPEVQNCFAITGEFDLLMVIRARSSDHLGEILERLRNVSPGRSRTGVVLRTFFEARMPPLDA